METKDITYIALFTALIVICSWISIPLAVPFTLQTMAIFTSIGLLGFKRGTISVLIYVFLGAIGLPVFAGFRGGIDALLGNTGGYILGFILSSIVSGLILKYFGNNIFIMASAMLIGLIICYAFGTVWFIAVYTKSAISFYKVLTLCVIPFIIPDILKITVAILLTKRLAPHIK